MYGIVRHVLCARTRYENNVNTRVPWYPFGDGAHLPAPGVPFHNNRVYSPAERSSCGGQGLRNEGVGRMV